MKNTIGELHGLSKVVLVASVNQTNREKRKTIIIEETSQTYNTFRQHFTSIEPVEPQSLLLTALQILWKHFPYWKDLDGKVGNAEDPGDGLLYDDERVAKAKSILQDLEKAWLDTEALAPYPPPKNLTKMGKICLILTGMQKQGLVEHFIDHDCVDDDLPLEKDKLAELLKPHHVDYAPTFAWEQHRAVPRAWEEGQHLKIDDEEEPLPLIWEVEYGQGAYGRVNRVRDAFSGDLYAQKQQITESDEVAAAARTHLEQETQKLKALKHRHIVQVVKTYQRGKAYGMLIRPAATSDLEKLMGRFYKDKFYHEKGCKDSKWLRPLFLSAFGCLSQGLAYIHDCKIRHKDVKPQNILYEKAMRTNGGAARFLWADFGLAYDFSKTGNSKTWSTKVYSPRYAAPEFVAMNTRTGNKDPRSSVLGMSLDKIIENGEEMITAQSPPEMTEGELESHGRAADIFSLGCVFLELLGHLVKETLPLEKHNPEDGKLMFSYNIARLVNWARQLEKLDKWRELGPLFSLATSMIRRKPNERPTVNEVVIELAKQGHVHFCKECWKEVARQDSFPSKSSQAASPPSSPRASSGMFLLSRVNSAASVSTSARPQLTRIFSKPSNPEKPI